LLLLVVGIHNAWESVAFHIFANMRGAGSRPDDVPEEDGQ
jgi:hypothetical protein